MPTSTDVTTCPSDLDRQSKVVWRKTRLLLVKQQRWRPEYSLLLERYVRACEVGRHARLRIAKRFAEGGEQSAYMSYGVKGQLVQHPDLKTAREAERDANDYATALMLTPASRVKLTEEPKRPGPSKFGGLDNER